MKADNIEIAPLGSGDLDKVSMLQRERIGLWPNKKAGLTTGLSEFKYQKTYLPWATNSLA